MRLCTSFREWPSLVSPSLKTKINGRTSALAAISSFSIFMAVRMPSKVAVPPPDCRLFTAPTNRDCWLVSYLPIGSWMVTELE
ncbi:hypothetical protein D3C75_1278190 [compost metagenome]